MATALRSAHCKSRPRSPRSSTAAYCTKQPCSNFRSPKLWREVNVITIAYGHGIAVSPLQVATAVSAVVNGGILHKATVLKLPRSETMAGGERYHHRVWPRHCGQPTASRDRGLRGRQRRHIAQSNRAQTSEIRNYGGR